MKKRLKIFVPWIIAAIVFYFLFKKIHPGDVLKAAGSANMPLFLVYSASYFIIVMLLDCLGLQWGISRFSTRVNFRETIIMRGATYMLMLLNYNLAQGGMAFYLKRTHKAAIFKTLGTVFYLTLIDFALILGLGIVTAIFTDITYRGIHLRPFILKSGGMFYLLFFLWIFFWSFSKNLKKRPWEKYRLIHWLLHRPLFFSFRESTLKDYFLAFGLRLPTILFVVFSVFLWTSAYYSSLPLTDILIYAPVILIAGSLPITPAGVGTVQALCVEFFKNNLQGPLIEQGLFTPEQIILSATLLWGVFNALFKVLFGLYCLKKKSKKLFSEIQV